MLNNLYTYTDYSVNVDLLKKDFGKVNLYAPDILTADKLLNDKYKKNPFKNACEVTFLERKLVHKGATLNVYLLVKK